MDWSQLVYAQPFFAAMLTMSPTLFILSVWVVGGWCDRLLTKFNAEHISYYVAMMVAAQQESK